MSRYESAENTLIAALTLLPNNPAVQSYLASVYYYQGQLERAEAPLQASLAQERSGYAVNLLALLRRQQGEYGEARELFAESAETRRAIGDQIGVAMALNNAGLVAQSLGDYADAKRQYEASGEMLRQLNNPHGVAATLSNAGQAAIKLGDFAEAERLLSESVTIKRELGNPRSLAISLGNLGEVFARNGEVEVARTQLRESLQLAIEADAQPIILDTLLIFSLVEQANFAAQIVAWILAHATTDEVRQRAKELQQDDIAATASIWTQAELIDYVLKKGEKAGVRN